MPRSHRQRLRNRTGATLIEFALILPLLVAMILGLLEFGRVMQAIEVASNAARITSRRAILPQTTSNTDLNGVAEDVFSDSALPSTGLTIKVLVNGTESDLSTASRGDYVTIEVTIPFSEVAVITPHYLNGFTVQGSSQMRKE